MGVTRKSASRLFRRHLTQDQEATDAGKIHALLLIAHGNDASDPHAINHVESNYYNLIYSAFVGGSPVARVVGRERGTLLEERGLPREHFGYPDGRSQVLVLDDDIEVERVKSGGTFVAWDPSVPASRVVKGVEWTETVEDAEGNKEDTLAGYGSFFVFQKWEQNVRAFASEIRQVGDSTGKAPEAVKALSGALGGARAYVGRSGVLPRDVSRASREAAEATRAEAGKAGADVLGRFDDGYPRALADVSGIRTDVPNDFAYSAVPSGPLSHMQAANPRRRLNKLATTQGAWRDPLLFPRRGMPYDDRPGSEQRARPTPGEGGFVYDPSEYPEKDVGLLFMAYNSDLRTQFVPGFEKVKGDRLLNGRAQSVQRHVISRKERRDRGLDGPFLRDAPAEQGDPAEAPAAGANAEAEPEAEIKPGDGGERFVTLKGGEYFFVPPIEFLRHIDRVIL
jgi:deferrochelatase/peroxidase EfeB